MYQKEKLLFFLRIKNIVFSVISCLGILVYGYYIVSMFIYYRDDIQTAWHAESMTTSIVGISICAVLLIEVVISRNLMGKAIFYSNYFEGDLDGYVMCSDLSEVIGKSENKVVRQLYLFHILYMKNFKMREKDGRMLVELYSKKALCECRSCGANIDKKIYFTGVCPYCRSSDLFAKVLTADRFYAISSAQDLQLGGKKPDFYMARHLVVKRVFYIVFTTFSALIAGVALLMSLDFANKYFDKNYHKDVLLSPDNHLYSYELIKADIMDSIIFAAVLVLVFLPVAIVGFRRIVIATAAITNAKFFAECTNAYIDSDNLPDSGVLFGKINKLKSVRNAIRYKYTVNCSIEKHNGKIMTVLAKKIVRDSCPFCGASIVDAVDENYTCKYCDRLIMNVIRKE